MSLHRFFELVPASLAWSTLVIVVLASRYVPTAAAIFIILFDGYWLLKTIYLSLHLRYSFMQMRRYLKIDWLRRLEELSGAGDWRNIYHLVIFPMYKEPYEVVKGSFDSLRRMNYPKDKFIVVLSAEERGGEEAKEILKMRDRINELLAKHTGKSLDKIQKDTDRDYFMSSQEALEYGVIDEVIAESKK